jgi:hypothetical protein
MRGSLCMQRPRFRWRAVLAHGGLWCCGDRIDRRGRAPPSLGGGQCSSTQGQGNHDQGLTRERPCRPASRRCLYGNGEPGFIWRTACRCRPRPWSRARCPKGRQRTGWPASADGNRHVGRRTQVPAGQHGLDGRQLRAFERVTGRRLPPVGGTGEGPARKGRCLCRSYSTLKTTRSTPQLVLTQNTCEPVGSLCENCTLIWS